MMEEKMIAFGGALKATDIDENTARLGGYLIYFTDETEKDLHEEYFDAKTDLRISPEKMNGLPVFYQHGLDETLEDMEIGTLENVRVDPVGVWAETQLDLHNEYVRQIYKLSKKGVMAWSSGAWPQSVKTSENGHIDRWRPVEGSFTPTPAMPKRTVISAKTYTQMIKDGTGHEDHTVSVKADTQDIPMTDAQDPQRRSLMDRLKELFDEIMALFAGEAPMDEAEAVVVEEAMRAEADELPEDEKAALQAAADTPAKSVALDKLMIKAAKVRQEHKAAKQAALATRYAAVKDQMGKAPAQSPTDRLGGVTKSNTDGRVTGVQDLRYAHLSASDMLLGYEVATAPLKKSGFFNPNPLSAGLSVDYLRAMTAKAIDEANSPYHAPQMSRALKSALPHTLKANELDASNIVGQGFEWAGIMYGTTLWEKPRADTIYDQLVSRGMGTMEIPQGVGSVYIPTEGSDPIVYSSPEANSTDSTGRPEVTVPITPFGTGNVQLTPNELKLATSYTVILGEDSVVPILPQLNRQVERTMLETRDKVILNGDTATAANTNINYIDSTPPTGIRRPYFLNSNGMRKLALVTNTAMSRDGGVFTLADFAATVALFPYAMRSMIKDIAFIMDGSSQMWALDFPQWLTPQVAGGRGYGTLENGVLVSAYGFPIITSGYIPLTGTAGKEYVITTGNNVKGTLVAAYLPHWMVGYKRQITVETARDILSGTEIIVASMRMGIVARGNTASAVSYNLSQA